MKEDINVTFIIPEHCESENECSEEMLLAFTTCEQHSGGGIKAEWVHENKWKKFDGLTKKDVFVLAEFDGDFFKKLKATKCLLVGPRCLSCCLTEGCPIPSGPEPVFTIAMKGLVVTASGLSKQQKENIKKKVHWMGGLYSSVLTEETTHLVSDTVLSDKYIKAVAKGIPVMCEAWIDAVWDASLRLNVNGSSSDFDIHRLPALANLQITTSGISKREKQNIMKLVNENGGVFSGTFQSETTDVVIINKEGVGSEKYKAALEYNKACVLPGWVSDSVAKGVALPFLKYRVVGASTSSPLAEHTRLPDMSLNFSRITNSRPPSNYVDETKSVDMSTLSCKMKLSQERRSKDTSIDKEVQEEFEKLDVNEIKSAGPIFDGFCIWVTGVSGLVRERAAACITRAGGVRYSAAHERVTHVVAGSRAAAAAARALLPHVPALQPLWLLRSVRAKRVLDEAEFLIDAKVDTPVKSARKPQIEAASPMSKRNLQLLRHAPLELPPPTPEVEEPPCEIVNHYLSQNVSEPQEKTPEPAPVQEPSDVTENLVEEPTEEIEQIFRGVSIEVRGLSAECVCEIGAEVAAAGGALAAAGAGAGAARVLVPLDWAADTDDHRYITVFWIKDCLSQQELLPIQYYHRPVGQWEEPGPLVGVVASLSTYTGVERAFLDELAKLLGATTQLRFCRRTTATALASTHLICPAAAGDKYLGALKWGLPAVTAQWLLDCASAGKRLSEKPYLVGDTKAPPSPEKAVVAEPLKEDVAEKDLEKDKENVMQPPAAPASGPATREQTPKEKTTDDNDMSPASRYIAMARQGLWGCDSQETPKRLQELKEDAKQGDAVRTPPLEDALSTPNLVGLSPTTRRRLQAVKRGEMPSDPIRTPKDPFVEAEPATPASAFGAALGGGAPLSPAARKRLWRLVHLLPDKRTPPTSDTHTPLSEIRNRFLAQFNGDVTTPPVEHHVAPRKLHLQDEVETPPSKMAKTTENQSAGGADVAAQLQRLSAALTARTPRERRARSSLSVPPGPEAEAGPESQPNTVGWDDTAPARAHPAPAPPPPPVKRFMLSSNVDNREEISEAIVYLGGVVCESAELDPLATHLLCAAPGRSEKMLGSVAAGKWVLHPAYVARSRQAGHFLPECEFEWGNPLARVLPALSGGEAALARAAHRWRAARAAGGRGPFAGERAALHVPPARRTLLARLLTAGGGCLLDDQPPYSDETMTVCFADIKRYPISDRDAAWFISRRIPVCPPVLLSSYLTEEVRPNPADHCLPEFRPK